MQLKSDSLSDIGRHRKRNEDCCYANSQTGLFIVADGLGGHPAGEIASQLAVDSLRKQLEDSPEMSDPATISAQLETALQQTNQQIKLAGETNRDWARMGTTATVALLKQRQLFLANVGDSRAYLLRDHQLQQLSTDHNPTDPDPFAGKLRQFSNLLTQALGLTEPLRPAQLQSDLKPGDRLLLCSDGLTNMLSDPEIFHLLNQAEKSKLTCRQLVDEAKQKGGFDNISVVVIDLLD